MENPRGEDTGKAIAAAKDPGMGHFYVSLAKSAMRITGCIIALMTAPATGILALGILFLLAELLGIAEELVD